MTVLVQPWDVQAPNHLLRRHAAFAQGEPPAGLEPHRHHKPAGHRRINRLCRGPGSGPTRTASTIWTGCAGPRASCVLAVAMPAAGGWPMGGTSARAAASDVGDAGTLFDRRRTPLTGRGVACVTGVVRGALMEVLTQAIKLRTTPAHAIFAYDLGCRSSSAGCS